MCVFWRRRRRRGEGGGRHCGKGSCCHGSGERERESVVATPAFRW